MSRIGKKVIAVPAGVTVEFENGVVTVKGGKGTLTLEVKGNIDVKNEGTEVHVLALDEGKVTNARHGLYRALIADMVQGVSAGFEKRLEVKGVGWKTAMQGNKLVLNVGFSHPVEIVQPEGIKLECATPTEIVVSGIDKALVGQVAADIRAVRTPEPYHGYGIHYSDEVIERKEGKTAGK